MLQTASEKALIWLQEIQELEQRGITICPLMMQKACQYAARDCVCDVPKTRAVFFQGPRGTVCFEGYSGTCLPRAELPELAYVETMPSPPQRTRRPRGAWTAALKR